MVLWGPGEEPLAAEVVAAADGAAMSRRARRSPISSRSRARAALMVSGDTGPTHIAAAVGTPLVGIYGPTRPARNGPLSPLDIAVSRETICRCHHLRQCRLDRMCLLDVEVAEVAAAVERRLSAESGRV